VCGVNSANGQLLSLFPGERWGKTTAIFFKNGKHTKSSPSARAQGGAKISRAQPLALQHKALVVVWSPIFEKSHDEFMIISSS